MVNGKEQWLLMIVSAFAARNSFQLPQAYEAIKSSGALDYIFDHYEVLHQLSSDEVIEDITDFGKDFAKVK